MTYYFVTALFGVASSFYIFRPILDELEKRGRQAEQDAASQAIRLAETKD